MTDEYRLLTLEEAAKLLRIRWAAARELVETGQLRAVRIGDRYRVPATALQELGRLPATPPSGPPSRGRTADDAGRDRAARGPVFQFKRRGADGAG